MNKKIKLFVLRALQSVLALFAVSSCEEPTEIPCMYGMPIADYQIKGKVTGRNGEPLSDVRVFPDEHQGALMDTVRTKSDGSFSMEFCTHSGNLGTVELKAYRLPKQKYKEVSQTVNVKKIKEGMGLCLGVFAAEDVTLVVEERNE